MALILTFCVYRRMKAEQEIEGLLWRINPDCLQVKIYSRHIKKTRLKDDMLHLSIIRATVASNLALLSRA